MLYGTTGGGNTGVWRSVLIDSAHVPVGAWTQAVLYSFAGGSDGTNPDARVAIGSGGVLYGATTGGGASNYGAVHSLTPLTPPGGAWTETLPGAAWAGPLPCGSSLHRRFAALLGSGIRLSCPSRLVCRGISLRLAAAFLAAAVRSVAFFMTRSVTERQKGRLHQALIFDTVFTLEVQPCATCFGSCV